MEEEHVAYVEAMLYLCVVRMTFSLRTELDEIWYSAYKNSLTAVYNKGKFFFNEEEY